MRSSRFIVGLVLVAAAVLIIVLDTSGDWIVGAIALAVLGIASVAISRRR